MLGEETIASTYLGSRVPLIVPTVVRSQPVSRRISKQLNACRCRARNINPGKAPLRRFAGLITNDAMRQLVARTYRFANGPRLTMRIVNEPVQRGVKPTTQSSEGSESLAIRLPFAS
jgi:hypothetical protein